MFFKRPKHDLLLFIFILFQHKFDRINTSLQRDSNSDRRTSKRSRWPIDPHRGSRLFEVKLSYWIKLVTWLATSNQSAQFQHGIVTHTLVPLPGDESQSRRQRPRQTLGPDQRTPDNPEPEPAEGKVQWAQQGRSSSWSQSQVRTSPDSAMGTTYVVRQYYRDYSIIHIERACSNTGIR